MYRNNVILGFSADFDYFVCREFPRFIAEFSESLELESTEPRAGAELKDGSIKCQVVEWIDAPGQDADEIAKHVRLAFDEAVRLSNDS